MSRNQPWLAPAIQDAMGQVRGARTDPDSAGAVDETLGALPERAERVGANESLQSALNDAQAAFSAGDTAQAVQRLGFALVQSTRQPPCEGRYTYSARGLADEWVYRGRSRHIHPVLIHEPDLCPQPALLASHGERARSSPALPKRT